MSSKSAYTEKKSMAVSASDDHRIIVDGFLRAGTVIRRSGLDNL
jgi:hypothetical protein